MHLPKSAHLLGMFAGVFLFGEGSQLSSLLSQPLAQTNENLQLTPPWEVSVEFPKTPGRGSPESSAGSGVRLVEIPPQENPQLFESAEPLDSFCSEWGKTPLTALMPANNWGKTISARPTLFWYLPKTISNSAELIVVDENRNKIYQTTFTLPSTPGIAAIRLPPTVSLEVGKTYLWELALICQPGNRGADEFVQGEIQRIPLETALEEAIARSNPLQRAQLYAEAGIWHETLETLARWRNLYPSEWEQLLNSVGLEEITSQPSIECCQAPN